MQERAQRPSRLVQSLARWAITLGAAGTILGATALYGVLLRQEPASGKYTLLVLAAVLLSLAFMLAPFVRRTFGFGFATAQLEQPARRTLLDEMRELEPDAPTPIPEAEPDPPEAALPAFAARLVTAAYVIYA